MQTVTQTKDRLSNLYWLAFLLTGDREVSIDAAADAAAANEAASGEASNPFFSAWMETWVRKIAISKALAAIRDEIRDSAGKTRRRLAEERVAARRKAAELEGLGKAVLERALLAMDGFLRCVIVLSVLERLGLEDVATLLDADREFIEDALTLAIHDLTRRFSSPSRQVSPAPFGPGTGGLSLVYRDA
jgi:hypothetical protein